MKKILAMMLSVMMILSMGIGVFAEETAITYEEDPKIEGENAIQSKPELHMDGANDPTKPAWYINFKVKAPESYEFHLVADGKLLTKVTPIEGPCGCSTDCGLTSGEFNANCKINVQSAQSDHWVQTPWTATSSIVPDAVYMYDTKNENNPTLIGYWSFDISEKWSNVFTGTHSDMTTIPLEKLYKLTNDGMTSPAETFSFVINTEDIEMADSGYTSASDVPVPYFGYELITENEEFNTFKKAGKGIFEKSGTDDTPIYEDKASEDSTDWKEDTWYKRTYTGTIDFDKKGAALAGNTNNTTIYLPEYDYVGIYTYAITEKSGNTAGVIYDDTTLYLKVTVIQDQNGKIRVAALRYSNAETGSKVEDFTNIYEAGTLTVEKKVTGNLGDQSKYFDVTVTFTAPNGKTVYSDIDYTANAEGKYNATSTVAVDADTDTATEGVEGWKGSKSVTIKVKHGDKITFTNIPYGVTYTVIETVPADYSATYALDDADETSESISTAMGEETGDESRAIDAVVITNTKGAEVDTGISVDSIPYIAMLGVVAIGGAGFLVSKKRRSED